MSSQTDTPARDSQFPDLRVSRGALRRGVLVLVSPPLAYVLVRPMVSSDAVGLAVAAAIPIVYSIVVALVRRRVDPVAGFAAVCFSLACLISVLRGAGSLPLKLHLAFITFGIGLVLVLGVHVRRPLPISRLLRIPLPDRGLDSSLGALIGGFLVLHALLHFALAVSLSTSTYLVAGRLIDWGTIALGVLGLAAFLRAR